MSGILSQAIANLESAESQIMAVSGLPAGAQSVQTQSSQIIASTTPKFRSMQSAVNGFVPSANRHLAAARKLVSNDTHFDKVSAALEPLRREALSLQTTVSATERTATDASNKVSGFALQLATVQANLNAENTKILAKKLEYEGAMEKMIHLGTMYSRGLGMPGMGGQMYQFAAQWGQKASAMGVTISRNNVLIQHTKQLGTDYMDIQTKLSSVKNVVDILAGDLGSAITDIDTRNISPMTIVVFIEAAQHEVATLAHDAS